MGRYEDVMSKFDADGKWTGSRAELEKLLGRPACCRYDDGGSHWHCGRCGGVSSMMGCGEGGCPENPKIAPWAVEDGTPELPVIGDGGENPPTITAAARKLVDATDNAERNAALGDLVNAILGGDVKPPFDKTKYDLMRWAKEMISVIEAQRLGNASESWQQRFKAFREAVEAAANPVYETEQELAARITELETILHSVRDTAVDSLHAYPKCEGLKVICQEVSDTLFPEAHHLHAPDIGDLRNKEGAARDKVLYFALKLGADHWNPNEADPGDEADMYEDYLRDAVTEYATAIRRRRIVDA